MNTLLSFRCCAVLNLTITAVSTCIECMCAVPVASERVSESCSDLCKNFQRELPSLTRRPPKTAISLSRHWRRQLYTTVVMSTSAPTMDHLPLHRPNERFDFVATEHQVLQYWRDIDAFQESLRQSKGRKPYTFYDGELSLPSLLVEVERGRARF